MSNSPLEHRVSRVENDVVALYDMIGDIQTVQGQHSADLTRIQAKLLQHDARFDAVDARFDAVDAQLATIGDTLAVVLSRLPDAS